MKSAEVMRNVGPSYEERFKVKVVEHSFKTNESLGVVGEGERQVCISQLAVVN